MKTAPILLFTYNRLWHTQQTVESLKRNHLAPDSDLYIFSDGEKDKEGAGKVEELRSYLKTIEGFRSVQVVERAENLGLANSIITSVTEMLDKHERAIILEDDMVSSPFFLNFMNDSLELYKDEESVACIHGYRYPIGDLSEPFFIKGADCWGWGTWSRAWNNFNSDGKALLKEIESKNLKKEFNMGGNYPYVKMLEDQIDGKVDSWAIRWKASAFLRNQYTLYYKESLIQNIGNDNSGTHSSKTDEFKVNLAKDYIPLRLQEVKENIGVKERIKQFYLSSQPSFYKRLRAKMASLFK